MAARAAASSAALGHRPMTAAKLPGSGDGWGVLVLALSASVAVGVVAGLFNGILIAKLGLPPILATLGSGLIFIALPSMMADAADEHEYNYGVRQEGLFFAGLAGALEVAGPIGQLTPYVPAGYGFAAIIVAYVGRLHPVGMLFSAVLMSMFYIGGELAQSRMGLPKSITGVFQGLLLFTLLACDTLMTYRLRWQGRRV